MSRLTGAAEKLSAELRDVLAASDRREQLSIDPRKVPWRFSTIKHVEQSPAHYLHACQFSKFESKSMRLGTGAHAAVFEPHKLEVYRKRRAGKDWAKFLADNDTKVILSESEHAVAMGMATALLTSLDADSLLFAPGTVHEADVTWQIDGRDCRGRIDALSPHAVIDLKGVKDAHPRWFPVQAVRASWHAQVTWYADACEAAGMGWRHPHLVAVQNKAPYIVTVWKLSTSAIDHGRALYRSWIEIIKRCEAANSYPGPAAGVIEFNVPQFLAGPSSDEDDEGDDTDSTDTDTGE